MHTGISRKAFSSASAFKPVLNNNFSTSPRHPTSRLPTSSHKKSAGASSRSLKENIPLVPSKQYVILSFVSRIASNTFVCGSGVLSGLPPFKNLLMVPTSTRLKRRIIGRVMTWKTYRALAPNTRQVLLLVVYPVLANLSSSMIAEADENSRIDFDYDVIDYDREYDINLKLESSLYETRLAARHNDSIRVTIKRRQMNFLRMGRAADDEASISLDYIPESDVEGILGVEYNDDDGEEADDTFDLSDFLSKNGPPLAPLPPLPVPTPAPVATEEADNTFDLSDFLDKNTPILGDNRLLNTSLSELMKVDIDYDREFPNTAIGRPPHIFVCRYKRDMRRKAAVQKASERKEKNRCVPENECIIDVPLQSWAPTFSAEVLGSKNSKPVTPSSIPTLIVTSPSDDDIVRVPDREPPEFDEKVIEYGVHKDFLLDTSYHNWCLRFGVPLTNELGEDEGKDEDVDETSPSIPSLIVTSPSDDDVVRVPDREPPEFDEKMIEYGVHKYFLLDASYHNWCLRFGVSLPDEYEEDEEEEEEEDKEEVQDILKFGEEGPLDEIY